MAFNSSANMAFALWHKPPILNLREMDASRNGWCGIIDAARETISF
jgi:hypothetical protein